MPIVEQSARAPQASGPSSLELLGDREWQDLLDKDDRTSPAEHPDMVLITRAELGGAIAEGYLLAITDIKRKWQPIGTAPKDGTRLLLAKIVGHPDHPTALWWATLGRWSARWKNWNDGVEPSGLADPTHWLPVPFATV